MYPIYRQANCNKYVVYLTVFHHYGLAAFKHVDLYLICSFTITVTKVHGHMCITFLRLMIKTMTFDN